MTSLSPAHLDALKRMVQEAHRQVSIIEQPLALSLSEVSLAQHALALLADEVPNEDVELIPGSPDHRTNFLEPLINGEVWRMPECDWGDCDNPAVTLRNDREGYGWLLVCQSCRLQPDARWLSNYVPMAADVLDHMRAFKVDQDTAVLRLGGVP